MEIDFSNPNFHLPIIARIHWGQAVEFWRDMIADKNNPHMHDDAWLRLTWLYANEGKTPAWYGNDGKFNKEKDSQWRASIKEGAPDGK